MPRAGVSFSKSARMNALGALYLESTLCDAMGMAKKRTKSDQSQRNTERLDKLEDRRREVDITEERSEPAEPISLEEEIRRRAYELYQARGRKGGEELNDWLEAEAEIRRRMTGISNVVPFRSAPK